MLAAAKVLSNGELIGSTPGDATAPISYTLTYASKIPGLGTKVTTINSSTFFDVVSSETIDGTVILTLSPGNQKIYLSTGEAASFVTALKQAKSKVDAELRAGATVAAPAPTPAPSPTTTAKPATVPAPAPAPAPKTTPKPATVAAPAPAPAPAVKAKTPSTTSAPSTTAAPAPAPKATAKPATTSAPSTTATPAPAPKATSKPATATATTKASAPTPVTNSKSKTTTATGVAAAAAATIIVTAPKKAVANTVDVPLKIAEPTQSLVPETAPYSQGSSKGLQGAINETQSTATAQDNAQFQAREDWRVRLALANDANYLYRAPNPGILAPLATTDGVVFPYTPLISVNYAANYDQSTLVHSNYKVYQYSGSSVDTFTITCDFTAQDTQEANYMLATIHFFKAMTKMFYGQDADPKAGTPPPMAFIFGLGGFQFDAHPLAISAFTYNLPNDVDYIRTTTNLSSTGKPGATVSGNSRLPIGVTYGGNPTPTQFNSDGGGIGPTYVPTKISISITCIPLQSRNAISNRFSLKDYATGKLLLGTKNAGGGMW